MYTLRYVHTGQHERIVEELERLPDTRRPALLLCTCGGTGANGSVCLSAMRWAGDLAVGRKETQ